MNKKGMQFQSSLFAIIVVGIVISAIGVIITGFNANYHSGLEYDLGSYDKSGDIKEITRTQRSGISEQDPAPGTDAEANTFKAAFGIIQNIFSPYQVVIGEGGLIDSVTDRFGIPDYIRIGIMTMITLAIIFAIVLVIFRLGRTP